MCKHLHILLCVLVLTKAIDSIIGQAIPALIFAIFGSKKQKAVNKQKTVCVCQNCGYSWDLK